MTASSLMGGSYEPFTMMVRAPGAFISLGCVLAIINFISARQEARKARS